MFTDGKKFGLQSCEADYVHLNAGIRLKSSFTPSVNIVPRSSQITGSWDQGRRGLELSTELRHFSRDPLPVFSTGSPCKQFWHGQGCSLFDVVRPAFPLLTTVSPALQGALKDGFGEAVVACDMPEQCVFLSLDSCQERFP